MIAVKAAVIVALGAGIGLIDGRGWKVKLSQDSRATTLAPTPPTPPTPPTGPPPSTPPAPTGEGAEGGAATKGPAVAPAPAAPVAAAPGRAPKPGEPGWQPTPKDKLPKPSHLTLQDAFDQHTFQIATFLDARSKDEYAAGHIAGAHLAPLSEFRAGRSPAVLATLPKESPIIVYCGGGDCEASEDVAILLEREGHSQVFVLHDGYPGWAAMQYPIATGEPTP